MLKLLFYTRDIVKRERKEEKNTPYRYSVNGYDYLANICIVT